MFQWPFPTSFTAMSSSGAVSLLCSLICHSLSVDTDPSQQASWLFQHTSAYAGMDCVVWSFIQVLLSHSLHLHSVCSLMTSVIGLHSCILTLFPISFMTSPF